MSLEPSSLEQRLLGQVRQAGLPEPCVEYRFHPERRWRFDMAWPELHLAVEIEGGIFGRAVRCQNCGSIVRQRSHKGFAIVYSGGRHNRGQGYERDLEKYNQAVMLGWRLLRFSKTMIETGQAIESLKCALSIFDKV